jgi:RNA polymerase sigma factor (sigma-70 family)
VAKGRHGDVWRYSHVLFNEGVIGDVADDQLLERFVTAHREAGELAFEALVARHGPMVLRICRTILRDEHDAEDAFQATFLVLARQAASIRSRASLASWLHGVARRVASSARSAASRRREHEQKAADLAEQYMAEPRWDDLAQVLHEEIDQLPERYRAPIVLCDMEGLTEGQAARRLGRPLGTIRSQITRGRQRLRRQLIRRGLAPASVVLVIADAGCSANAVVASALVNSTVQSAMQFAVARATTAGMVSAAAAALTEEFLRSMLMTRIKNTAMAALVAIGIATAGAFALEPQAEKPPSASDAKQDLLDLMHAWGKALVQSDVAMMDRLLAYEMSCTDPGGGVWDKSEYLEFVKTNFWHVESYKLEDTKIQVYGDAAVVTGLFLTNTDPKRRPYVVERYTKTWIRRHGTWQCVALQTMITATGEHESDAKHPAAVPASKHRPDDVPKGGTGLSPTSPPPPAPRR